MTQTSFCRFQYSVIPTPISKRILQIHRRRSPPPCRSNRALTNSFELHSPQHHFPSSILKMQSLFTIILNQFSLPPIPDPHTGFDACPACEAGCDGLMLSVLAYLKKSDMWLGLGVLIWKESGSDRSSTHWIHQGLWYTACGWMLWLLLLKILVQ